MEWLQVGTIAGTTIGCCWFFRKETKEEIAEMRKDMKEFKEEQKDFHGRMCKLEERYYQMMQRVLEKQFKE
jgi:hypothetical protein